MKERVSQPMAGTVVVDLTEGIAGPFCTKLLADFGARVVKVEGLGGDVARQWGPFRDGVHNPEASGTFLHLNTNKESLAIDIFDPAGAAVARRLVDRADVVVEDRPVGMLAEIGLDATTTRDRNPASVYCSITPFGQSGPYRDYQLTEIVAFAMGGPMNATGAEDREPVKLVGNVVQMHAGANAAAAVLGALLGVRRSGVGRDIDVAIYETQNGSLDRRRYYHLSYQYSSTVTTRQAVVGLARNAPGGVFVAKDGRKVQVGRIWPTHYARMVAVLDDPEVARTVATAGFEQIEGASESVNRAIADWVAGRTAREAMREAQAGGWPVVVVNDPLSLLTDEHLVERGFWVEADHPHAGTLVHCGPPWRSKSGGWDLRRAAPTLGQDSDAVLRGLGYEDADIESLRTRGVVA